MAMNDMFYVFYIFYVNMEEVFTKRANPFYYIILT